MLIYASDKTHFKIYRFGGLMTDIQRQRKEAIYLALAQIPKGNVITYGDLAKLAGIPNGARLAGKLMGGLPRGSKLPWHRVINSQGKFSMPIESEGYREQKRRLMKEGIEVVNEKISLKIYGYKSQI